MPRRYLELYPELFADLDEATISRFLQTVGSRGDGSLFPREVVVDVVNRVTGGISFQEHRERWLRAREQPTG
ncbi:hypothetical protein ACFUC1_12325 [Pedococcus sp. NPDC057267]|uniref:hypothetical protein n=1 Tax=Pedococcus sp. NPDC057267 TaxID=3346077 RepID=UPI00362D3258